MCSSRRAMWRSQGSSRPWTSAPAASRCTSRAPREWAGQIFDAAFVSAVPPGIDPCGENGEFHTFVFEGPMLRAPVTTVLGQRTEMDGMVCVDLLPDLAP